MFGKWVLRLSIHTIKEFMADDCMHMAAGVAYYALFSLFPLVLGLIAILGLLLEPEAIQQRIVEIAEDYMPISAEFMAKNLRGIVTARGAMGIVAVIGLLWSALAIFAAIRRSINRAWDVEKERPFIRQKLLEIVMLGVVVVLFLTSFSATSALQLIRRFRFSILGLELFGENMLWNMAVNLIPLALTFAIFMMIYKFLPNASVGWGDIWLGALVGAIGFEVAKNIFIWYAQNIANYNLVYGSVAGVIILLFWAYLSAIILLFGAELASEYAKLRRENR